LDTTLLIDGNSLLKTGFHGVKNMYNGTDHIGGLYHFLNTLRKQIDNNLATKVVVFWDGKGNSTPRRKIVPEYKANRIGNTTTEENESFNRQKLRTQEYLEELYVRQGQFNYCEADDCLSQYCEISKNETIMVFTSDRDLLQLISPTVSLYILSLHKIFRYGGLVPLDGVEIPHENVRVVKTICGDSSDNIHGIKLVGIKSLAKIYPKTLTEEVTVNDIIKEIKSKEKHNKREENILKGITKNGEFGMEVLTKNYEIIGVGEQFLTDEAISGIEELSVETIDPEGRHWKNALGLMMSDGILNFLPKTNDSWVDFVRPFLRLTRIEKDFYKKNKK
jgi:5'-3' exonuclease